MPRLSHSSFLSSKDRNGFRHSISIDPNSAEKQRDCTTIYDGRARSSGGWSDSRDGSILQAKFTDSRNVSSEDWVNTEMNNNEVAQNAAMKFNNTMKHVRKVRDSKHSQSIRNRDGTGFQSYTEILQDIEFQILQTAQLDTVATFARRRKKNEHFLILDKLYKVTSFVCSAEQCVQCSPCQCESPQRAGRSKSKSFSKSEPQNAADVSSRRRCNSEGDSYDHFPCNFGNRCSTEKVAEKYLHAFVHYFFSYHNGEKAIDCLRGEHSEGQGYTLTTPVIHSIGRTHGGKDEGPAGILRVIENHVCTDLCAHLPAMEALFDADWKRRLQG